MEPLKNICIWEGARKVGIHKIPLAEYELGIPRQVRAYYLSLLLALPSQPELLHVLFAPVGGELPAFRMSSSSFINQQQLSARFACH